MDAESIAAVTGARAVVVGARIQTLWGGYGEIVRARIDGTAAVVKEVRPPPGDGPSHLRKLRSYDVELAWYRRHAARSPARVARYLGGARGLIVLEDLDEAGYTGRRGDAYQCLAWLARFHLAFRDTSIDDLWDRGTYWHLGTRLDELPRIADPALREAAPLFDARLRASPFRTLLHGDAKPDNFCFGPADVAAVDFQYVGPGCALSDVAYLICGDPDEDAKLDRYCAHLRELGAPELEGEARAVYPFAAADFYRFLAGWAPHRWPQERHGQRVVRDALRAL